MLASQIYFNICLQSKILNTMLMIKPSNLLAHPSTRVCLDSRYISGKLIYFNLTFYIKNVDKIVNCFYWHLIFYWHCFTPNIIFSFDIYSNICSLSLINNELVGVCDIGSFKLKFGGREGRGCDKRGLCLVKVKKEAYEWDLIIY